MNKNEIGTMLKMGIVIVKFTKMNGEDRIMRCTLNPKYLPEQQKDKTVKPNTGKETAIRVWDLDESDWRAFRYDSIHHAVLAEEA